MENPNPLKSGFEKNLSDLYGTDPSVLANQKNRYLDLRQQFSQHFNSEPTFAFSVPGRTELGGNHTDHQHGKVLAAAVDADIIALVSPSDSKTVTLFSDGFDGKIEVDTTDLAFHENEIGKPAGLIRGIAKRLAMLGFQTGGFNGSIQSEVLVGSGLSSSAAFEVLIGLIFSSLFNSGKISPVTLAQIGQWSENHYFGKPCGLMDQLTCSIGGVIGIDFADPENPAITPVQFDLDKTGYRMLILNTGSSHDDLTADYASVPNEMKDVALLLGKNFCSELNENEVIKSLSMLRKKAGDRAILRVLHFFQETRRAEFQAKYLAEGNFQAFLKLSAESGNSSYKWLQNVIPNGKISEQTLPLALGLTEHFFLTHPGGVCRIQGGGFAGTIQIFIKKEDVAAYLDFISPVFGMNSVRDLSFRNAGAVCLGSMS